MHLIIVDEKMRPGHWLGPELSIRRVSRCRPLAWSTYNCAVTSLHGTYGRNVCANLLQFPVPSKTTVIIHTFNKTLLQT